jgi:hypothetical protein
MLVLVLVFELNWMDVIWCELLARAKCVVSIADSLNDIFSQVSLHNVEYKIFRLLDEVFSILLDHLVNDSLLQLVWCPNIYCCIYMRIVDCFL